jgi:dihydrofolate synthase/folylpolyglutamate synthase
MYLSTLPEWLSYISSVHVTEMDLGLERVKKVAERLKVLHPACTVITIGGTNGKGSTAAGLESVYRAAHYRTGVFTSPYLFRYNEQIRIDGQAVEDEKLCAAFAKVEAARADVSLTPFEFGTLAALVLFKDEVLDVWILEVGLGGRLDAVNIIDTDIAVITSIAIDHVMWLGDTREKIGAEKAGIFREGKSVVCGDEDAPESIVETAHRLHAPFYQRGKNFHFQEFADSWTFTDEHTHYKNLPLNGLATQNMSVVIKVICLLQNHLPVTREIIETGLKNVSLPFRIQIIKGPITKIYDVSHNPASVAFLRKKLDTLACTGKTHAVFSMLEDKDIVESILHMKGKVDFWQVAPLNNKRAASEELLRKAFETAGITHHILFFQTLAEAFRHTIKQAEAGDRIIIFGSFHTVAEVLSVS